MRIGRIKKIAIGLEKEPGVAVSPTHSIPFLSFSLQEKHTPIADNTARGMRNLEGSDSVEGKKWGEGSIEVPLDPDTAPYWFALALGKITSESTTGGFYKHTIEETKTSQPLTATIETEREVGNYRFLNSVVDKLELNFADDIAKLSIDVKSKYPVSGLGTIDLVPLTYYTFKNASVKVDSQEIKVKEFTLTISNNVELIYYPGSNDVGQIIVKGLSVEGSFSSIFENKNQLDAFDSLTKKSMEVSFSGSDGKSIKITIPQFRVNNWTEGTGLDDISDETIDFVAEYNEDKGKTIGVEVVNKIETYYNEEES